jgi:hypothetical protein
MSSLIWLECRVLEGSVGELQWTTCPEIAGSDGIHRVQPCFFRTVWFHMERLEASHSIAIVRYVFSLMVKSVTENDI